MNNYDELYFTIMSTNKYAHKGSFDYKSYHPKQEGNITCTYKKIKFINDNKIQISNVTETCKNLEIYGEQHCSYSPSSKEEILDELTYEELVDSEYWGSIKEKYEFNDIQHKRYLESYVEEDKDEIYVNCQTIDNRYISLRFNKFSNQVDISSSCTDYYGDLNELQMLDREEYDELQKCKKIVDLIKNNHKVQILTNGYVVDNVFYEDIQYYEDKVGE